MTDDFDNEACDYLLNQMDSERRLAFEQELQRNAAARAALKRWADSLAGFACDAATPEALTASDQREVLDAIVAAARSPERRAREPRSWAWRHFVWPAAAAVLLALNLLEFERPITPGGVHRHAVAADTKSTPTGTAHDHPNANPPGTPPDTKTVQPPVERGPDGRGESSTAKENLAEMERLRTRVAELQQTQDRIRAEYDRLVQSLADQAAGNRELNRLTTMELVDAATFARGERKGLVSVAREILTEPGVVTPPNSTPAPPPSGASSATPVQSYAWSVFDEKDHRGYLNLYQLPVLPAEQAMQVWVRPADAQQYQRVAEVPSQYQGGNGSVQYVLPAGTAAPAEVLITIEPRTATPAVPTGPTVLRGP